MSQFRTLDFKCDYDGGIILRLFRWTVVLRKDTPPLWVGTLNSPTFLSASNDVSLQVLLEYKSVAVINVMPTHFRIGLVSTKKNSKCRNALFTYCVENNFFSEVIFKDQINCNFTKSQNTFKSKTYFDGPLYNFTIIGNLIEMDSYDSTNQNDNVSQLQNDLKTTLKNGSLYDVTLKAGNDVLKAHKCILSSRSSVFQRMFENDMRESKENVVEMVDIRKNVLETFITFLYTGVVEDETFDTICDLYSTADKYEVKTLQKTCNGLLVSYLSEDTVPVILKLADLHNDESLKENAVKYICDNFSEVETTDKWIQLIETDPRLVSYTLRRVSTAIKK